MYIRWECLIEGARVDPSGDGNYAIRVASQNGHIEIMARLLQDNRVDPTADDNFVWKVLLVCQ